MTWSVVVVLFAASFPSGSMAATHRGSVKNDTTKLSELSFDEQLHILLPDLCQMEGEEQTFVPTLDSSSNAWQKAAKVVQALPKKSAKRRRSSGHFKSNGHGCDDGTLSQVHRLVPTKCSYALGKPCR